MNRRRMTVQCAIVAAVIVAGCGESESSVATVPVSPAPASSPASSPPPSAPASSEPEPAPTTDATVTSEPAPTTEPGAPGDEAVTFAFPPGDLTGEPEDVLVLGTDGDLRLYPGALTADAGPPVRFVDNADPFGPVQEGPAPNVIEDVAGLVGGAVVYGVCCEPISGSVFAVPTADGAPVASGIGFAPTIAPDGSQLATVNDQALTVVETSTGDGRAHLFDHDPDEPVRSATDVEWIDDETLAVVFSTPSGWFVESFDAATFTPGATVALGVADLTDGATVRFAGRTPDGEVAVAIDAVDRVVVRFLDPDTLAPGARPDQSFPAGVMRIEIDDRGAGAVWVDDGTAYFLPAGAFEARPIAADALAVWFVRSV